MSLFLKIAGAAVAIGVTATVAVRAVRAIPSWKANRVLKNQMAAKKAEISSLISVIEKQIADVYADMPLTMTEMLAAYTNTDMKEVVAGYNNTTEITRLDSLVAYLYIVLENLNKRVPMTRDLLDSHIRSLRNRTLVQASIWHRVRRTVSRGVRDICLYPTIILVTMIMSVGAFVYQAYLLFAFGVQCVRTKVKLSQMSKKNVYGATTALYEARAVDAAVRNVLPSRPFTAEDLVTVSCHRRYLRQMFKRLRSGSMVAYADILYLRRLKEFLLGTQNPTLLLAVS